MKKSKKLTDKDRLDWLTKNNGDAVYGENKNVRTWVVYKTPYEFGFKGKTPRQAIDAAIKSARKSEGE